MRVIPEFENELKEINPNLSVVQNPNRPNICNIKYMGTDICPIPSGEIYDEANPGYGVEMPNGMTIPHRTRLQALDIVRHTLSEVEKPGGADVFFGRNGY